MGTWRTTLSANVSLSTCLSWRGSEFRGCCSRHFSHLHFSTINNRLLNTENVCGWLVTVSFFGVCGDFFSCKQGELSSSGSSLLLNAYRGGESRPSLKVVVVSFWKNACWLSCSGLYKGQYYYHACMANMKLELVNSTILETDKQRA